jgi:ribonuclease HI
MSEDKTDSSKRWETISHWLEGLVEEYRRVIDDLDEQPYTEEQMLAKLKAFIGNSEDELFEISKVTRQNQRIEQQRADMEADMEAKRDAIQSTENFICSIGDEDDEFDLF